MAKSEVNIIPIGLIFLYAIFDVLGMNAPKNCSPTQVPSKVTSPQNLKKSSNTGSFKIYKNQNQRLILVR